MTTRRKPFNTRNTINATVIASVAAIELACSLLAPRWPIPCAIVGTFVGTWATVLRLPVSGNPPPP